MKPAHGLLLLLSTLAMAEEPVSIAEDLSDQQAEFIALMEFVGGWEKHDSEWVDAMSLDESSQAENESDDE